MPQKKHVLKQAVICAALDCAGHYGNNLAPSVFFNVCIVSKSPAEFSPPIGGFMELRSNVNLPHLVNLALNYSYDKLL